MNDIYGSSQDNTQSSLRYLHIISRNVVGILNRISSLMRRKRYNMEEVSVSFDDRGRAHFIIAVDGSLCDIELMIHQIQKLQDVFDVYDATHLQDHLFNGIYVEVKSRNEFKKFPIEPVKIVEEEDFDGVLIRKKIIGIFMIRIKEAPTFYDFLESKKYKYVRRIMSLI